MPVNAWRHWLRDAWMALAGGSGRKGKRARPFPATLRLEELESRVTPTDLAFHALPNSGTAGQLFTLEVAVESSPGVTNTDDNSTQVTLTVASGPGGFTSLSTTTATAKQGIALFSNLAVDAAGPYTFQANDGDLKTVSSSVAIALQNIPLSLSPPVVQAGQSVTLTGNFTDQGSLITHSVDVVWGDGSADTILNLAAGSFSFSAPHVFSAEGDYFPTVAITDADGSLGSGVAEEQVLAAPFQTDLDVKDQPGHTISGAVTDAPTGDVIDVTLTQPQGDTSAGEFLGVQFTRVQLPATPGILQTITSYDFRQHNLGQNDSALVTLFIRGTLEPGTVPVLLFLDPKTQQEHVFHGFFQVVQEPNLLVVSIDFSNASNAKLVDLSATVFTIAAAAPGHTASVAFSASVASASATATAPVQTATFQSTSQLRLTLATTQLSQVSQSLSSLGEGGGGGPSPGDDSLAQFIVKELQSLLQNSGGPILRLLTQRQPEANTPDAPAPADMGPSAPQAPDVPDGKEMHEESRGLPYLEPVCPFDWTSILGRAIDAGAPTPPDGAKETDRAPRADHEARAAAAAAVVGLGLQVSKRRKRKERAGRFTSSPVPPEAA